MLVEPRGGGDRSYVHALNDSLDIDALYAGDASRFMNHSKRPNGIIRGM